MKLSCTIIAALSLLPASSVAFTRSKAGFGVTRHSHAIGYPTKRWSSVADAVETSMQSTTEASAPSWTLNEEFSATRDVFMTKLRESGKLPPSMEQFMYHFASEYSQAAQDSECVTPQMAVKNMLAVVELADKYGNPKSPDHFTFGTAHKSVREPMDFYRWGIEFFLPMMDLANSVVLGEENLRKAFAQVEAGENVVFLANHQSEADPQVMSVLMESIGMAEEATKVMCVAGHKVTTDAMAVPFSMGRNLLCIHSKKHINADPETKPQKSRENMQAMSAMTSMMKEGGATLWVAPSGGRDRRNVETGEVPIAPFDQKTVDLFRLIANKSKTTTHFYPFAMVTYEMCPPPDTTVAGTGEVRNVRYAPVGIACGAEMENVGGVESRHLFTEKAEAVVAADYNKVLEAIAEKKAKNQD